jgi:hypothetical protein
VKKSRSTCNDRGAVINPPLVYWYCPAEISPSWKHARFKTCTRIRTNSNCINLSLNFQQQKPFMLEWMRHKITVLNSHLVPASRFQTAEPEGCAHQRTHWGTAHHSLLFYFSPGTRVETGGSCARRNLMSRLSLRVFYLLWRQVLSTAPPFILWWSNLEILFAPLHSSSPFIRGLRCQAIKTENGPYRYITERTQKAVYIVKCLWPRAIVCCFTSHLVPVPRLQAARRALQPDV